MDWKSELVQALASPNGNRDKVLQSYIRMTGYSKAQLYRIAKANGWTSGRKQRSDKGQCKLLNVKQLDFIAALIHTTSREIKGPIMPVARALEIAEDNGIVTQGSVSVATVQRQLREREDNAKSLKEETPCTAMRSLHPNHVHVFDVSVCIQYYLKNGKMGMMDERNFYRNKVENYAKVKQRLMRYVVVDHFSGLFYFRYFYSGGESEHNLLLFLLEAWGRKEDARYPFHGVPFLMLLDAGAANKAGMVINLFKELEVEVPKGLPHNPRKQGAVETTHNIIERNFESGLRIEPASSEEQLNQWAFDWQVKHNATKNHTRHGMTRTASWMLIRPEQLRIMPTEEKCKELMRKPVFTREVKADLTIPYNKEPYRVKHIDGIRPGARVEVHIKAFSEALDVIYKEKTYEVMPVKQLPSDLGAFRSDAAIIGEEYKAQPETLTQKAVKRFENMAYGEEGKKKDSIPFEGLRIYGMHADKVGKVSFMEKKGTPIEIDRSVTAKEISIVEFLKRLRNEIGTVSRELNRELRSRYGSSIEIIEAEEVIEKIKEQQFTAESAVEATRTVDPHRENAERKRHSL